jgi:hypothetical protein
MLVVVVLMIMVILQASVVDFTNLLNNDSARCGRSRELGQSIEWYDIKLHSHPRNSIFFLRTDSPLSSIVLFIGIQ